MIINALHVYASPGWHNKFIFCFEPNYACTPDVPCCVVAAAWWLIDLLFFQTNHKKRNVLESKKEKYCYKTGVYYCA